jgi:predicted RNA-binding Zn-ribbon protein involved in translation (DUF1610 family)
MTNRTLFLLLALGCWAVCGALLAFASLGAVQGDRGNARLLAALLMLSGVGGLYFLIAAFSKRRHRFGYNYHEYTTFSCPTCQEKLDYSQFPAFTDEMPCPKCGQALTRRKKSAGLQFRFVRSPEVSYELSTEDSSPPSLAGGFRHSARPLRDGRG